MKFFWNEDMLLHLGIVCKWSNRLLNLIINCLLVLILLYGLFALNDVWSIFRGANVSDVLLDYKPELSIDGDNPTIQELIESYPDVKAWLTIVDTSIDYPIVQGEDNQEYVKQNVEGNYSLSGAIFLDCQNTEDFTDDYNILYGHHMDLDKMFGGLDYYMEEEYMNEYSQGYLFLPDVTYELEIFATITTDAYDINIFIPIVENDTSMEYRLDYIKESACVYRDIDIDESDRILIMSTCSNILTNERTVVVAKILE